MFKTSNDTYKWNLKNSLKKEKKDKEEKEEEEKDEEGKEEEEEEKSLDSHMVQLRFWTKLDWADSGR